MDGTLLAGVGAVGLAIGFAIGHGMQEAKLQECREVARQTEYFGTTAAARAMAFAECVSPKEYRLRAK
jgi:hypothetical protein